MKRIAMAIKNIKTKQQRLQECIKLMEKLTGKKVVFKEYLNPENVNNPTEYEEDDYEENIGHSDEAMISAILDYINEYKFELDSYDPKEEKAEDVKKRARIACLHNISEEFGIDWGEVSNEDKAKISKTIDNKLRKIKLQQERMY